MKAIKMNLALASLAALLCVPAVQSVFADGKPAQSTGQTASDANKLSDDEKAAGFKLLFDGDDMTGWHTYKKDKPAPGWEVKDGVLSCVKPGAQAGDLCTND